MPFVVKRLEAKKGQNAQIFLYEALNCSMAHAQKLLDRKRVYDEHGNFIQKTQKLSCEYIEYATFEGEHRGLNPMFTATEFSLFDKPSGVLVHPATRNTPYCLLDEVKYHFGEDANITHRIDAETSGLLLVSRNKYSEQILKIMWDEKEFTKKYLALVEGEVKDELRIDEPIGKADSFIRVKMKVRADGKKSTTMIKPLQYNKEKNQTLLEVTPITGRQHQIRVHLEHIGHRIVGDPIYGVSDEVSDNYLGRRLSDEDRVKYTGSHRLWLHANYLEFRYQDRVYMINSKNKEIYEQL